MSMFLPSPPEWDLLLSAAQKNDPDKIRSLIEQDGVDPSHANQVGQSAVHIAALWGNAEALKALLEFKADVNSTNRLSGASPLHCASQSIKGTVERRMECIDLLLKHGADPSICDYFAKTPVDYVDKRTNNNDEYYHQIIQKLQPKLPEIFMAIQEKDVNKMKELLGGNDGDKAEIIQCKNRGRTPLLQVLKEFLKYIQDVQEEQDDGKETRSIEEISSASSVFLDMFRALLEAGSDPDSTPSSTSANGKRALINGEDDDDDDEPLFQISRTLQLIARKKKTEEDEKKRDVDIALIKELQHVAKLFAIEYNAKVDTNKPLVQLLLDSCRRNEIETVHFFIKELKMNPNSSGRQGMTPLHFASRSGKIEIVKFFLATCGTTIDITKKDDLGKTPLDAARINNHPAIVELLEKHNP